MKHAARYPKHEDDKGTIFGGECNRTACNHSDAEWFNMATFGYYCASDAKAINFHAGSPLCFKVDHDLNLDEMNCFETNLNRRKECQQVTLPE